MTNSSANSFLERLFPYPAIGHDDPNAVEKLNDKLKQLQAKQELWKAIRKITATNAPNDLMVKAIVALDNRITEEVAIGLLSPDHGGRIGIADYQLQNNNGVMKSIRDRLGKLQRVEAMPEYNEAKNGVNIHIDKDLNRIVVSFDTKPSNDILPLITKQLKQSGFRWSGQNQRWTGNISKYRLIDAQKVFSMVPQLEEAMA